MIPELGHFALALALALALAQGTLPILGAGRRDPRLMAAGAPLAYGQLLAVLAGFGALMRSFVVSDTTVMAVVQNSRSAKPLLYKLSGTWGNHEGSGPSEAHRLAGYEWRLEGVRDVAGPNWSAREARVTIRRDGAAVTLLEPQRRFYAAGRQNTTETAIHASLSADLYALLGEERDGAAVLRLHHNPLPPWIWLRAAVMALGGALSLSDGRVRVAAPAPKAAASPTVDQVPAG